MALILCLETATRVCSVSLTRNGAIAGLKESDSTNIHSSMLTVFIEEVMRESGFSLQELDAVAVSMGPGSYTGLRIGVAAAKGLCYALDKPLIAVSTLQAMAEGMNYEMKIMNYEIRIMNYETPHPVSNIQYPASSIQYPASSIQYPLSHFLFCPMIDARRMEVFCGLWDHEGREIRDVRAEIIDGHSFLDFPGSEHTIVFGGDGAEKCKPVLAHHPNVIFLDNFSASATFMNNLALEKYHVGNFENLAYFEPFYLKDFVAGKPRVKGLK